MVIPNLVGELMNINYKIFSTFMFENFDNKTIGGNSSELFNIY